MNRGSLLRLQTWRRAIARTLVVALILPALLGLVPKLPLSADQALAQAIMDSVCDATGQKAPHHAPPQHDQSCVLCAISCASAHASDLPRSFVVASWLTLNAQPIDLDSTARALQTKPWRSVIVPRGPPAV